MVVVNRKKRRKKLSVPGRPPGRQSPTEMPEAISGSAREDSRTNSGDVGETVSAVNSQVGVSDSEVGGATLNVGGALQDLGSSGNLSSSPSVTSISSELEVGTPKFVALDTALLGNQSSSEAEAEAAASATALVLSATLSSSSSSSPQVARGPPEEVRTHTHNRKHFLKCLFGSPADWYSIPPGGTHTVPRGAS